ncbi:MAG TPA: hypothetical protein VLR52_03765, partial [Bacteroidales bacterium]|nr:hypothetical protein [Bacteroidales bacterium]
MRSIITGFILTLISLAANSQNDAEAIRILDKFSSVALGAPSVSMKFTMHTIDQLEGTNDSTS